MAYKTAKDTDAYENEGDYEDDYEDVAEEEAAAYYQQQPSGLFSSPGRVIALGSALLMLVVVLGVVVWLLASRGSGNSAVAVSIGATDSVGLSPGKAAPDFQLVNVRNDQPLKLSSLRGKPVLLNFWGTWCPPCRAEMPLMQKYYNQLQGKVEFLGVSMAPRDTTDLVKSFLKQNSYNWMFVHDADDQVAQTYQVGAIPSSYFIDKNGVIQRVHLGEMSEDVIQSYLSAITAK